MDKEKPRPLIRGVLDFLGRYFFLFFILLIVVLAVALRVDPRQAVEILGRFKAWQIILFAAVCLLMMVNFVLKNTFLMTAAGHPVSAFRMGLYYFSSSVAHYTIPGKAGYPVTAWLLKKFERIPLADSSSILMADFIVSFSFTALVALAGSVVFLRTYLRIVVLSAAGFLGAVAVVLLVLYLVSRRAKKDSPWADFLRRMLSNFRRYGPSKLWPLLVFYVVNALLSGAALWLLVHFTAGDIRIERLITADTVSFILGSVSFIPMGLGVQDVSMLFFLTSFGLAKPAALTVIFFQRTIYMGLIYILGLAANLSLGVKDLRQKS